MRLFEIAGTKFTDDLANLLQVMQGRANSQQTQSFVTWPAIEHLLMTYGHGGVSKEILDKVRDQVDPAGELIQDITDKGIVLKTAEPTPTAATDAEYSPKHKSVDRMASNAAKNSLRN
jgi:hypothetical protein